MKPLLLDEKVSTLKKSFIPKPVVLPVDSFDSIYNDSKFKLFNNLIFLTKFVSW